MILRDFFQPLLFYDPFCLPFKIKNKTKQQTQPQTNHAAGLQQGQQSKKTTMRNSGKKMLMG